MADLVGQHGLDLFLAHPAKQAGADCDQRVVASGAGGEGVEVGRVVDGHLGAADAGLVGQTVGGLQHPALCVVAGLFDDLGAGRPLGDALRHRQGDEGTAHADDERNDQQPDIARGVQAERPGGDAEHDAQQHHDREVGADE